MEENLLVSVGVQWKLSREQDCEDPGARTPKFGSNRAMLRLWQGCEDHKLSEGYLLWFIFEHYTDISSA